ncbi:hypothetical protein SDC9_193848 [bioreactor metagenome]|uniref:Uncharacterized protein n=1 Tax=bioreactor metagenome TaxID=1076179 RepID=A0A645IFX1_9ZZZZ
MSMGLELEPLLVLRGIDHYGLAIFDHVHGLCPQCIAYSGTHMPHENARTDLEKPAGQRPSQPLRACGEN